jgi:hypothetical protein
MSCENSKNFTFAFCKSGALQLYIEDFIGLFEFFPVFITVLRVIGMRILLVFM